MTEVDEFRLTPAQDKARDVLISDATHVCGVGGSRSGKTFLLARQVFVRAMKAPNSRHLIARYRFNAAKQALVYDTIPKMLRLCYPTVKVDLNKSDWFYTLENGAEVWIGGLDDKERAEKILGNEYVTIYLNETSQIPWASRVLVMTRLAQSVPELALKGFYDLNPTSKSSWVYRLFVDKKNPGERKPLKRPDNYALFQLNPADNRVNLPAEYFHELDELPEQARNRFLLGLWSDDAEGALWTEELLGQNRVLGASGELPQFLRVVVAVDPSGCRGEEDKRSDEVGIAVCALGTDGHGYLLEDLSGRYKPEEWAVVVSSAYERHQADRVVGESNFGGDMVRAVLQAHNELLPYSEVHASRGKMQRAEPIAALYEQEKIHHVGYHPEIEEQLCMFTNAGYQGGKSPDRADALVWGFTELFPGLTRKTDEDGWTPPAVHTRARSASRYGR